MPIHGDAIPHSLRIAANIRAARELTLLTDTTVAAADTNAGLQAAVTAAAAVSHADLGSAPDRINDAIQYGKESGELSDANILGLTTIVGLLALVEAGGQNRIEQLP